MGSLAVTPRTDQHVRCGACGLRFAWTSLAINVGLAAMKGTVGVLTGSHALLISSLYSVNDVLSAAAVLASLKVAKRPADDEHPFGYGKVEFIAVGAVSLVLAASVVFFIYELSVLLSQKTEGPPNLLAAAAAGASLIISELLARRGFCAARHLGSPALHSSAEHNRSDAISSGAVVVGVIGAAFGLHFLDRLVAVVEAVDLMKVGGGLLGQSVKGLMDAALPQEQIERVRRACMSVPGIAGIEALRSRQVGSQAWLDLVLIVSDDRTVQQTHELRRALIGAVHRAIGGQARIQVAFRPQVVEAVGASETVAAHA